MKHINKLIIIFLFSIFNTHLLANDKIVDSFDILKAEIQDKISQSQYINNDLFYKLTKYAKKLEDKTKIINAYYLHGRYYLKTSESEKSLLYLDSALNLTDTSHTKFIIFILTDKAMNISFMGDYYGALKYFNNALELSNKSNITAKNYVYYRLAAFFRKNNQFQDALKYYNLYHNTSKIINTKDNIFSSYINKLLIYSDLQEIEIAEKYRDTLNKLISTNNSDYYHYSFLVNSAYLEAEKKNYTESNKLCYSALNYSKKNKLLEMRSAYLQLLENYLALKIYDSCLPILPEINKLNKTIYDKIEYHKYCRTIYSKLKDLNKLNAHSDSLIILKDSVIELKKSFHDVLLNSNEKYYELNDSLSNVNQQILLKEKKDFRQKILIIFQRVILILTILILILVFIQFKTNRKKRKELEVVNKKLSRLIEFKNSINSIMSHDLKNYINNIISFYQLKEENLLTLEEEKKLSKTIKESSYQMNLYLNGLLQTYHLYKTSYSIAKNTVLTNSLISSVLDIISQNLKEKELTLKILIDENISITADENILKSALLNILSNSIKFTPKGKTITIKINTTNTYTDIIIEDEGVGMTDYKIDKILNKEKIDSTLGTDQEKGTGFGLNLVQLIMEEAGMQLLIESEINKGSTFTIRVPNP